MSKIAPESDHINVSPPLHTRKPSPKQLTVPQPCDISISSRPGVRMIPQRKSHDDDVMINIDMIRESIKSQMKKEEREKQEEEEHTKSIIKKEIDINTEELKDFILDTVSKELDDKLEKIKEASWCLPKQCVEYLAQITVLFIVIIFAGINLSLGSGNENIWIGLLSICIGYIIPAPSSDNSPFKSNDKAGKK